MFLAIGIVAGATVIAGDVDLKNVQCVVANKAANLKVNQPITKMRQGLLLLWWLCWQVRFQYQRNLRSAQTINWSRPSNTGKKAAPSVVVPSRPDKMIKIAGTEVGFCCDGCKSKVASAKDDAARLKLVFSDKAFGKGFEKKAKKASK